MKNSMFDSAHASCSAFSSSAFLKVPLLLASLLTATFLLEASVAGPSALPGHPRQSSSPAAGSSSDLGNPCSNCLTSFGNECTDDDHDGYRRCEDCNDHDDQVNPGQAEICGDGVDNDCRNGADSTCDDGNPCTLNDTCDSVDCVGTAIDCDDSNLCTDDSCDDSTGQCIHSEISCDDGTACTDDLCEAATGCSHPPSATAHITVTDEGDSGPGTLRQAIADLCDGGVIDIQAGLPPIVLSSADDLSQGASALLINKHVTIHANGATIKTIEPFAKIGAQNATRAALFMRIFFINTAGTLTLDEATLRDGHAEGTVSISCVATGVEARGGAIYNTGVLDLRRSTIQENQARGGRGSDCCTLGGAASFGPTIEAGVGGPGRGGALYNGPTASATIVNCTLTANEARGGQGGRHGDCSGALGGEATGGAIYNDSGVLNIRSCTLDGNTVAAGVDGGTLEDRGSNDAGGAERGSRSNDDGLGAQQVAVGGGLYSRSAGSLLSLHNTIIADTPNGRTDCFVFGNPPNAPASNKNLIESHVGCGTPAVTTDPLIQAIGDNGGPTETMAILPGSPGSPGSHGSPAIDAGDDDSSPASDQRGFFRPADGDGDGTLHSDIGAYEASSCTVDADCGDDGLACTTATCVAGVGCVSSINSDSCLIGGVCYAQGAVNPTNECEACGPAQSQTSFSARPNGFSCDDGNACTTPDTCQSATCVGGTTPETCDGADNDCDGSVDEDFPVGQPCTNGIGACERTGALVCHLPNRADGSSARPGLAPTGLDCDATPGTPSTEVCDGADNDCDGSTDEGNPGGGGACSTGQPGICGPGHRVCTAGSLACARDTGPVTEVCANAIDDDCDGSTDEGCAPSCGTIPYTDPFTGTSLETCWNPLVDPVNNSSGALNGAGKYVLEIPAGTAHDCWTGAANCTRLVRNVPNVDTIYETRIDGVNISLSHQDYGIFLWQNDQNHIRFEFWTAGGGVYVRAYKVINNVGVNAAAITTPAPITLGASNFLRVTRIVGTNTFILEYSQNGANWFTAGSTTQAGFIVNKAGLFVNNAIGKPKTTLNADYWSAIPLSAHTLSIGSIPGPGGTPNPVDSGGTTNLLVSAGDSQNHTLNYAWSVLSCTGLPSTGSFTPSANIVNPVFHAPVNTTGSDKTCVMQVVVDDGIFGLSQTRSYNQTVRTVAHTLSITSGPSGTPNPVAPGGVANLSVAAADSLGHAPTFLWLADCPASLPTDGVFNPNNTAQNPAWTAPANATGVPVDCTIKVTVHDPAATPAPDQDGSYTQTVQADCGTLPFTENFTAGPLDACWSFLHPNNIVAPTFTPAGHYTITVPSGASHDCWNATQNCTRLVRTAPAGNATYVVKIDGTNIGSSNQDYGIILQQDACNYLRFEYWTAGSGVYVKAFKVIGCTGFFPAIITTPAPIALGATNYLRVTKTGTNYQLEYGTNGTAYTNVGTFPQAGFTVNQAGVMVNNAIGNPQTSASVDLFSITP